MAACAALESLGVRGGAVSRAAALCRPRLVVAAQRRWLGVLPDVVGDMRNGILDSDDFFRCAPPQCFGAAIRQHVARARALVARA